MVKTTKNDWHRCHLLIILAQLCEVHTINKPRKERKERKKCQCKMIGMMVVVTTWWRKYHFSLRAGSQTKAALTPPTSSRGFIILNRKNHEKANAENQNILKYKFAHESCIAINYEFLIILVFSLRLF